MVQYKFSLDYAFTCHRKNFTPIFDLVKYYITKRIYGEMKKWVKRYVTTPINGATQPDQALCHNMQITKWKQNHTKNICIYCSLCSLQGWACPDMSSFNPIIKLWRHLHRLTGAGTISPLGSAIASAMQQKQGQTIEFTSQSSSHATGHCAGLACPGVTHILIRSNCFNRW